MRWPPHQHNQDSSHDLHSQTDQGAATLEVVSLDEGREDYSERMELLGR
jgi:hypothetical protein